MISLAGIANTWWSWVWPTAWQFAVLVFAALLIDLCIRRWAWPQVRLALWMAVALKLLIAPTASSPISATAAWSDLNAIPVLVESTAHTIDRAMGSDLLQAALAAGTGSADPHRSVPAAWLRVAFVVWAAGVLAIGGLVLSRSRALRRQLMMDGQAFATPPWILELATGAARQIGLRAVPPVLLSRTLVSPAAVGLFRPVVLLPADWAADMPRRDVRHALLHEFAHLRRGDLLLQGALTTLLLIYWFHPAAYVVNRRIARLRELCCDATVATALREQTAEYRQTLLRVAQRAAGAPRDLCFGMVGLFERPGDLLVRIRALHREPWKRPALRRIAAVLVGVGIAATVLPMGRDVPEPCATMAARHADRIAGETDH